MVDMLVKLYDLKPDPALDKRMADQGFVIRRVLPPELRALTAWIGPRFGEGWVSEATVAVAHQPASCFIAVRDGQIAGFACYDATARGFFGPTGVDESMRGKGVGHALLLATLLDLRNQGYGYGIIGGAGPTDFYARSIGAIPIEGSIPGIYANMLPIASPDGVSESRS
ncbi:GNAT family N-acetyltransferase [Kaistia dalseonensis]|uniref:GNAT superfamily N-acetyltransferase n=1 Tax=Kaistia dalseonensis TaxID=410840 RepID=A0ABU0HA97_9HYPH|nr:GNAT family N-acetyltransferase [Kaistia dalseonensis]MCX5496616.1 GNAT family N-acetyltransferase [Kaistia dalseonensis]MDQ0439239.1 GNAT superfamily N-acetyltransferase [Kaistia dalseonensis]